MGSPAHVLLERSRRLRKPLKSCLDFNGLEI